MAAHRRQASYMFCTARVEWRRVGPRVLLHALRHYVLQAKIILADSNLAISTQTAKPPNLIPRQIFWLYSMFNQTVLLLSATFTPPLSLWLTFHLEYSSAVSSSVRATTKYVIPNL